MNEYEYAFPEVFVEGVESNKYLLETINGDYVIVDDKDRYSYSRFFGHILYEDVLKYIDVIRPAITKSLIVVKKYQRKEMTGLLVERDVIPCLIEIRGYRPVVFINEGDHVEEGDKISYVITNKGEVRVERSPCSGVVLLVINIAWEKPEKYIVVVVGRDEFRQITIREST